MAGWWRCSIRHQVSLLLTSVRNAVSEAFQRLPRLVALFAAEAVTIQVKNVSPVLRHLFRLGAKSTVG